MRELSRRNIVQFGLAAFASIFGGAPVRAATTHEVKIEGFAFNPAEITVKVGDTIRWTNADGAPHTATSKTKAFDTGKLDSGNSAKIIIDEAGEYNYFCQFHPSMKAKVIAEA